MERIVLHSDLNNFYASAECLHRPELWDVPMAVTGDPDNRHGIILSKNEKAKALGIKTGEPIWKAREKCRNLICVLPRYGEYMYLSKLVRDIYRRFSPRVESFGLDEAWIDMTNGCLDGGAFADELRALVQKETGLTVSIGVSFNKIFAKLGSDMKKPNATTVITKADFRDKVWPLPVEELLYVGRATKRKLNNIGVVTIGDLARMHAHVLRALLGKWGEVLKLYAAGEDCSQVAVSGEEEVVKSVGNSSTPPRDLKNDEDVKCMFYILSESVAARLRAQGLKCSVVSISVRDKDLFGYTRQLRLKQPTFIAEDIADAAMRLFKKSYSWAKPVRSVGVSGGDLSSANAARQLSCFDEDERALINREKLEWAVDGIKQRFGNASLQRACVLGSDFRRLDPKEENVIYPAGFVENEEVW